MGKLHQTDSESSSQPMRNHVENNHVTCENNREDESDDDSSEEDSDFEDPDDVETKLRKSVESSNMLYMIKPMVDALNTVELSPEDVVIAGFPKSGTNWLEQICHQIRTKGTDEDFEELTDEVPLLQLFSVPMGYDLHCEQKG